MHLDIHHSYPPLRPPITPFFCVELQVQLAPGFLHQSPGSSGDGENPTRRELPPILGSLHVTWINMVTWTIPSFFWWVYI